MWIRALRFHIHCLVVWIHRQPRLRPRVEARIGGRTPLHRCTLAVAAFFLRPAIFPDHVPHIFQPFRIVRRHSNLFPVIENRRTAQSQQHRRHQLRNRIIVFPIAIAIHPPPDVVIAEYKRRPPLHRITLDGSDLRAECRRTQLIHHGEVEIHRQLQLVIVRAIVSREFLRRVRPRLPDQHPARKLIRHFAQSL